MIHYNLWFLNKGWRIHLLSLLLYEEKALFLSLKLLQKIKYEKLRWSKWMDQVDLYRIFLSTSTRIASTFIGHGELRLLHQWVCDTSPLRSLSRPNSPREQIHSPLWVAHLSFAIASWVRVKTSALWNLLAFGSRLSLVIASSLASCSPLRVECKWFLVLSGTCLPLTRLWCSFTRHG